MKARAIGTLVAVLVLLTLSVGYAEVLPPGGGSGAIFTTTPDGSIVNENVHYEGRHYVYLDGGPKQNAPAKAAGLDEGFYVFQVTDPPGKILLSRDPARCRIVHVNAAGVIDQLMAPTDNSLADPDGNTVVDYTGAGSDNWAESGKYSGEPCQVPGPDPDSAPGTDAPIPDITGVGRHDTNPDTDHNDVGAIVVQLMPYGLTPNPGGVYKAWMTPIQSYVSVKQADLNDVPSQLAKGKQKPHECYDFCADADAGFVPSNRYTKTDNFKVTEQFPAEIRVRKFHDLNGNGLWDDGEPEIGVDQFVLADGTIDPSGGGWPYAFTQPLDGGTTTDTFYTPHTHVAGMAGTYTAEEFYLDGWTQTAAYLDGDPSTGAGFVDDGSGGPAKAVSVDVAASAPGEVHEIVFGNFMNVEVTACKYKDLDGDGGKDEAIPGWTVYLTIDGAIVNTQQTGADGCYTWTDLGPLSAGSYYDVEEETRDGWTATGAYDNDGQFIAGATGVDFESPPQSGASYKGEFTNFENVEVTACKYKDLDGDGGKDEAIPGWTVYLTIDGAIVNTQQTGADGCYTWTDLGPLSAGSYYDVEEETRDGWTATGAYDNDGQFIAGATGVDFESPPQSGASYKGEFTNFENVSVEACKLRDIDGSLSTTDDQSPIEGWTVNLTKNGEIQDTQQTGSNGCYKWTDLPPVPGGYYDVSEEVVDGWIPLTPTFYAFESPPKSGASYSFTFINTPTQGCTPGYWKNIDQHLGSWQDAGWSPDQLVSEMFSRTGSAPYADLGSATLLDGLSFQGGDTYVEKAEILLRAAIAAVLNADNPNVAYAFTSGYIKTEVNAALDAAAISMDGSGLVSLAKILDGANNAVDPFTGEHNCPLGLDPGDTFSW